MSTPCSQPRVEEEAISYQLSTVGRTKWRAAAVLPVLALLVGCSAADKRKWESRTPEQNYATALEDKNPTLRREAVSRIGRSGYRTSADAFAVLDVVARTDPVSQVRCVAIRVLADYRDERPPATFLRILSADPKGGGDALPGDDDVRWEAARALARMQGRELLTTEQQVTACELYIQLLRSDRSRNVRIVSTQALGLFKDRRVLTPLINSLRNEDFMIADSAERSLMQLTGTTHEYDADAWTKWVEQTPDPFANSGAPVATSRPAGGNWWDQQQRVWRKTLKLGE